MHEISDHTLLQRLKQNDRAAFTEIYNRYWDKLFAIAGHKLHNLHIAEELVQDIFLDLWNRRHDMAISGELRIYLSVAMKYKVINVQARQLQARYYEQYARSHYGCHGYDTEAWVRFRELQEQLAAFVNVLPEKCRLVYTMSRDGGLSRKEIAHRLDISEKTVETHLTTALKKLRTRLGHLFCWLVCII